MAGGVAEVMAEVKEKVVVEVEVKGKVMAKAKVEVKMEERWVYFTPYPHKLLPIAPSMPVAL